jgi:phage terminase small subunit
MPGQRSPAGLKPAAKAVWRSVVDGYELERHHLAVLEAACRELDRAAAAEELLADQGEYLTDRYGGKKVHPAVAVARSSRLAAARLLRELGLQDEGTEQVRLPRTRGYGRAR